MLNVTALIIQQERVLKARVALALYSEFGSVPKEEEIEHVYRFACVLYKSVLGAQFLRRQQKQSGQLAPFKSNNPDTTLC